MRKYGLIGFPLGHSFSQKYFAEKFRIERISGCVYENYPLSDISELPSLVAADPELCGLNVTIPYKSAVLRFLDIVDKEASEIGAVNVIKIKRDKKLVLSGFNSDIKGIYDSLQPFIRSDIRHALVLGTGGSSRAVCYVLGKLKLNVTRVSRNRSSDAISYSDIDAAVLKKNRLVVNTTPLGMFPNLESCPDIDYRLLGNNHIMFDLVYNPEITLFLRKGAEQGTTVISGLKMLHSQAERAWEIWNDDKL